MGTNIIISGSTGFVGRNLVSYLTDKGFSCKELSRDQLNLVGPAMFSDCDSVVHLAGKAHDLKKASDPDEYYRVNLELTKKMYDAFLRSDARKFIFISSVKAVADTVSGSLTEDAVPGPQTHYGRSKLMAEQYIQSQPLPAGRSYYILRPSMIHGPGNKGNLNLLYHFVKKRIPYPLAAFHNKRSFLSVENLCYVISEILNRDDLPGGVYNVADDEVLSTNELIVLINQALNKKSVLWHIPPGLVKTIAKAGDVLKLPLNTERLNKLTENYMVDNRKIISALGAKLPIAARSGIITTIRSFK